MADLGKGYGIQLDVALEDSKSVASQIESLVSKLNKISKNQVLLDVGFKNSDFTTQLNQINNLIDKTGLKFKNTFNGIDIANLQKAVNLTQNLSSQSLFTSTNSYKNKIGEDIQRQTYGIEELIKKYQSLGYEVSVTSQKSFADDKQLGKLREFTLELTKQNGIIEKMSYSRNTAGMSGEIAPFNLKSVKSVDNTSELQKQYDKSVSDFEKAEKEKTAIAERENKQRLAQERQYQKEIDNTISLMSKQVNALDKNNILPKSNIEDLRNQVTGLSGKSSGEDFSSVNNQLSQQIQLEKELSDAIKQTEVNAKLASEEQKARNQANIDLAKNAQQTEQIQQKAQNMANDYVAKTNIALNNLQTKYGKNVPVEELASFRAELSKIQSMGGNIKTTDDFDKLKRKIQETKIAYSELDSTTRGKAGGFFGEMSHNIKSFLSYFVGAGGVLGAFNAIKQGIGTVVELENSMISLERVYDMSSETARAFQQSASDLAKSLGDTSKNIIDTITNFKKLGYSINDAQELAVVTTKFNLAADINNIGEATTDLISILKGFKLEASSAVDVTNQLNTVSNNYAVTAGDLATSLQKSSATLKVAGNDISQSISLTTVAQEVNQNAEKVGNGLKTIAQRMRGVSTEGEEVDAKLGDFVKTLTGVDMTDANGNFRSTYDILLDIGKVWDTLDSKSQANLSEKLFGKNQATVGISILENAEQLEKVLNSTQNSFGSVDAEFEKYLNSTTAKFNQLKETITGFWTSAVSSNMTKGVLDAVNLLANAFLNLPTIIGVATSAFILFKGKALESAITSIVAYEMSLGATTTASALLSFATKSLTLSFNALKVAIMTNPLGALAVAVTAVISVMSVLKNRQKEQAEAEKQQAEQRRQNIAQFMEQNEQLKKSTDTVNNLLSEQANLNNKGIDKLTADEKERLKDIEGQLAEILPEATTGYDGQNKALAENYDLTKKLLSMKQDEANSKALEVVTSIDPKAELDKLNQIKMVRDELLNLINSNDVTKATSDFFLNAELGGALKDISKEQYKELTKAQGDEATLLKTLGSLSADYSKQLNEGTQTLNSYNEAVGYYNSLGKKQFDTVEDSTLGIVANTQATKDNAGEINNIADMYERRNVAIQKYGETSKQVADINNAIAESEKKSYNDASKAFDEATGRISTLQGLLSNLNDSDKGLSSSDLSTMTKEYPQLLAYLGDETELRNQINNLITNEADAQKQAYTIMMQNDQTYYNNKIKYNTDVQNKINDLLKNFVDNNGNAYQVDLKQFKSLHEAKVAVLGIFENQINKLNAKLNEQSARINNSANEIDSALAEKLYGKTKNTLDTVLNTQSQIGASFDAITFDKASFNAISGINNNLGGSGGNSKKDVEDLDLKINRYKTLEDAITNVNNALEMNKQLQEIKTGQERVKLIEQEVSLLNQKKNAQEALLAEQKRAENELANKLRNNQFSIDSNGLVVNYVSRLQSLQNWANQASGDEKERRKQVVEDLKSTVDEYTELVHNSMASTLKDITAIEKEVMDIQKEKLNTIKDVESEIVNVIKKSVDEKKKQYEKDYNNAKENLQKQKDLYNKENEENDYQDSLKKEQDKAREIQDMIDKLSRDTSRQSQAKVAELMKELETQQEAINKMITDHERDQINDRFDQEQELLDKQWEEKQKELDEKYSNENLIKMAQNAVLTGFYDLDGVLVNVKDAYIDFSNKFGEGAYANGKLLQTEFIDKLSQVKTLLTDIDGINKSLGVNNGNLAISSSIFDQISKTNSILPTNVPSYVSLDTSSIDKMVSSLKTNFTKEFKFEFNQPFVVIQGDVNGDIVDEINDSVDEKINELTRQIAEAMK